MLDIKSLVAEAGSRFGGNHKHGLKDADKEKSTLVFNEWFAEDVGYLELDEVVNRLRDLIESEIFPIADC